MEAPPRPAAIPPPPRWLLPGFFVDVHDYVDTPLTLMIHKDVVTEIALRLPLKSLFRCRAVCKLWRDVIDSPSFRKLHILSDYEDETVYLNLQLNYDDFKFLGDADVILNYKAKSILNLGFNKGFSSRNMNIQREILGFSRAVKGLICFNMRFKGESLAICNPFLGQVKILPHSSNSDSGCERLVRDVGIGHDGEFYKVVEVSYCRKHSLTHARLYSRRTDSWRDLGLDQRILRIFKHVHLSCNDDGRFAHWYAMRIPKVYVILTFDMKNEVFWTTEVEDWDPSLLEYGSNYQIVAKEDGCSFIRIVLPKKKDGLVTIFESSISICEGIRKLDWYYMTSLEQPPTRLPPLWRSDCVMIKFFVGDSIIKRLFYDYRARRFLGGFDLRANTEFFYYKGTFISP